MLIGIPSMSVPLVQGLQTPKIALFSEELDQGVAKLAGTAYDPETGELVASSGPRYGFSHKAEWTALLVVSWSVRDESLHCEGITRLFHAFVKEHDCLTPAVKKDTRAVCPHTVALEAAFIDLSF